MQTRKFARIALGSLLAFGALNAFGGGWYGLSGAPGIPLEWLDGSPFKDYFVPSLFLFFVLGGSMLAAAVAVFLAHRLAWKLALATAGLVLAWIAIQVGIIGYVSWMQPTTAVVGVLMGWLAVKVA